MNRILRTLQHLKSLKLNASWDAVVPTRQKHSYVFVPFALGDTIIVRRLPAPAAPNAPVGPHVNQVMQPAIVGQQMNQYLPHSVNQLLNQPFGQLINQPLVGQLMNQQQLLGQPPVQIPAHIYGGYALVPQLQQPCRIQGPHAHAAHPPPPRAYYPPYADLPPLQHTCHPYFVIYAAVRHFEQRQDLTDAQLQVYSGLRAVVALWDDLKEFPVDVMYGQPFWAPFKGNNRPPLVRDSPGADEEDEEGGRAAQQWENGGSGSNVALKRAPGGDDESSERRTRRKIDAHKVKLEEAQRGLDDDYSEDLAGAYGTGSG
ncbi:hypothetical protein BV25DRAFT_1824733 [Artomyces pyxidatus]|uniref:Uncharacterized protein n=1 Tax=Artomyces pyxidatus TaxID=48021 RepID=A0ACB8T3V1_9AGAM|nr:hypothetical protein BV25DRAFT_1824733 [Artomyces pyxidatus]